MKVYCQTNEQLILHSDCVIRDKCEGCGHLSKARKDKMIPGTINDTTREDDWNAVVHGSQQHFTIFKNDIEDLVIHKNELRGLD